MKEIEEIIKEYRKLIVDTTPEQIEDFLKQTIQKEREEAYKQGKEDGVREVVEDLYANGWFGSDRRELDKYIQTYYLKKR